MIEAEFYSSNGMVTGFRVTGHSGFAEEGSDIVCASVSSAAYMTANTVTEVLHLAPQLEEDDGYLLLKLADTADWEAAADILGGFLLHMAQLSRQFPQYITVINTEV